jgi:hypothetical protein
MRLDNRYHLLSARNTDVFPRVSGTPEFSAYIADLAFQKLTRNDTLQKQNIWDPYCGNGIILRTISVLHRPWIMHLFASDIREEAVMQTKSNISICSTSRYHQKGEFRDLLEAYCCNDDLAVTAFTHDATDPMNHNIKDGTIDLLITDPPYENMESYFEQNQDSPARISNIEGYLPILLSALRPKMRDRRRVGLILDTGFEDVLAGIEYYAFERAGLLSLQYKNRILYTLRTSRD